MSDIGSKIISDMSRLSNKLHIRKKVFHFSGIIIDMLECIIFIFKVDGHSVFSLYFGKPAGDSRGLSAGDPQQYFLTPCKNPACY